MLELGQKSLDFSDGLLLIPQFLYIFVELLVVDVKVGGGIEPFCDGGSDVQTLAIEFRLK